jgi:nucleotide-binding universal stress UspA family protein
MTPSPLPRSERLIIVVGFDFTPLADHALREAAMLAARRPRSGLHLVWAVDLGRDWTPPEGSVPDIEPFLGRMQAAAEAALQACAPVSDTRIFHHVIEGDAAGAILAVAEDVQADLVVVGSHGRTGVGRLLIGSVAENVMRKAGCPVLVMRPRRYRDQPGSRAQPPCPACLETQDASGST